MTGRNKGKKEVEKEDAASSGVIVSRNIIVMPIFFIIGFMILSTAYWIRLMAIQEYGPVIHEFDPYFNLRATEYLYQHGAKQFFQWFDYMSWYPLGRPVGTTIYPGMQFTAVFIKEYIVGDSMSLNDVCCYIPAWFGVIATFITGLIAYECTLECNSSNTILSFISSMIFINSNANENEIDNGNGNGNSKLNSNSKNSKEKSDTTLIPILSMLFAMMAMAVIPAHLMRSVGGGFDNESVAMSAMTMTFYFWVRSLRTGEDKSYLWGVLTGLAYFYMVAAWGGYVFVLNMIGIHAALLVVLGRFSTKIYLSYTIFYVIGTALAVQIPVVGWTPLKSLEQLSAFAVFLGYQVLQLCEVNIRRKKMTRKDAWQFRVKFISITALVGIAAMIIFTPTGYFGPISSRVRGLFVKHTKTGNPLVDSVAEHQPAKANSYFQYLQHFCTLAPLGFVMVLFWFGDSPSFVAAYGMIAYFFSHKMVRLILLMAPVASILGGVALGRITAWCVDQVWPGNDAMDTKIATNEAGSTKKNKKGGKAKTPPPPRHDTTVWLKRIFAMVLLIGTYMTMGAFNSYCWSIGKHLSNPSIIMTGQTKDGNKVVVDDYREAYHWIRDKTPQDARIMAWWDYGYQITSIANRTTIADGNTWNHEHIALLARILTGPVDDGYKIARHMADYMLVWAGGGGDDMAKSPHLARIANSVYRNMCSDPVCSQFGYVMDHKTGARAPSKQMERSLIAHLVSSNLRPGIEVDPLQFQEVFRSKYGKVRVYKIIHVDQESKSWAADPKNRKCDVDGGWFCRGQYPPALLKFLQEGKDFAQLEDFNKKGSDQDDEEYQKQYFDGMKKKDERMRAMKKNNQKKKEL